MIGERREGVTKTVPTGRYERVVYMYIAIGGWGGMYRQHHCVAGKSIWHWCMATCRRHLFNYYLFAVCFFFVMFGGFYPTEQQTIQNFVLISHQTTLCSLGIIYISNQTSPHHTTPHHLCELKTPKNFRTNQCYFGVLLYTAVHIDASIEHLSRSV